MQINAPCDRSRPVIMWNPLLYVALRDHIIADYTVAFTLSAQSRRPHKFLIRKLFFIWRTILQPRPVAQNSHQSIIADIFDVTDLITVLSRLPIPTAIEPLKAVLIIEFNPPIDVRKRHGMTTIARLPQDGMPHNLPIRLFRSQCLAETRTRFPSDHHLAATPLAKRSIACAIRKQLRAATRLTPRPQRFRNDCFNDTAIPFHANHLLIQQQVLPFRETTCFPFIFKEFRQFCLSGLTCNRADDRTDIAKLRIRSKIRQTACPDANFTAAATAQNTAILNQQCFHTAGSRRQCRADARITAADHNQIIFHGIIDDRHAAFRTSESRQCIRAIRWLERCILRKINRVATTVEACQIMQRKCMRPIV